MQSMNYRRIILGGLVAGVIINLSEFVLNGVVLMEQAEAYMAELELTYASWAMPVYVLVAFVWGFGMVATYAAVRPRLGAGPGTALAVGIGFWLFAMLLPMVNFMAMGLGGGGMIGISVVWTFVEAVVASVAGAWIYREEPEPARVPAL